MMILFTKTRSFDTFFVFISCHFCVTKMHATEYLLPVIETKLIIILLILLVLHTNWKLGKLLHESHTSFPHWD
jgi:hypothetical protein